MNVIVPQIANRQVGRLLRRTAIPAVGEAEGACGGSRDFHDFTTIVLAVRSCKVQRIVFAVKLHAILVIAL